MGYRGKLVEKERARALSREGLTMLEIATQPGVSNWTRDVTFTPRQRELTSHRAVMGLVRALISSNAIPG